jgi:hypothetical protein
VTAPAWLDCVGTENSLVGCDGSCCLHEEDGSGSSGRAISGQVLGVFDDCAVVEGCVCIELSSYALLARYNFKSISNQCRPAIHSSPQLYADYNNLS